MAKMMLKVLYYRITDYRTWKRHEECVAWDEYLDLVCDEDVIIKRVK